MTSDDQRDLHRVRASARRTAMTLTQWPLLAVLTVIGAGAAVLATSHWRWGSFIVGCGVGLAAVLRLVLPGRVAGLLVVRSRWFDVLVTGAMAVGILAVTLVVPPMSPR